MLHAIGIAVQLAVLLSALLAIGCSGDVGEERDEERARPLPAPTPRGYEPIEVVNGGTLTGRVTWSGEQPELPSTEVTTHREACGERQPAPVLSVSHRGGVGGAVVWLDGVTRGRALEVPAEPVEIVSEGCRFAPHVLAVPVGARVAFRNADPVLHNVRASFFRDGAEWLSRALAPASAGGGAREEALVARAGVVRLVDDAAHPWMLGWIHAFEHPYFARTDADGRFQLTGIPSGRYTLRMWHEGIRATGATEAGRPVYSAPIVLTRSVTLQSGHDTTVDLEISAAAADAAGD